MTDGDDPSHRFLPRIRQELDKLPLTEAQKDAAIPRLLRDISFLNTDGNQCASGQLQPDSTAFEFGLKLEAVVDQHQDAGLTIGNYLAAAIRQPSLMTMNPDTIASNINGIVERFAADGLTKRDYIKAALKQPQLFYQSPATLASNITDVVEHFAADGLTTRDYLQAALKEPPLFAMSPATVIAHIETVSEHFREKGLTLAGYMRAAIRQPSLFTQSPDTIIGHVNLIIDLHRQGLVRFPGEDSEPLHQPLRPLFDYLVKKPAYFCLANENFTLRDISAHVTGERPTGTALLLRPRYQVERELGEHLGQSDPGAQVAKIPPPADGEDPGSHARNVLLRALIREGLIKGTLGR